MSVQTHSMPAQQTGSQTKATRGKPPRRTQAGPTVEANALTAELATREERIRFAAYLLAERRGFAAGCELDDWLAAEKEVDRLMAIEPPPVGFVG